MNGSNVGRMSQTPDLPVNDFTSLPLPLLTIILSVSLRVTKSWFGVRTTDAVRR